MAKIATLDFRCDLDAVKLWQYTDAIKLLTIINNQQKFADTNIPDFWRDFDNNVFNLTTANTFGLALWGRLLNSPRPTYTDKDGNVIEFTDEQYRLVLRAKIYLLTFNGSAQSLNHFFKTILPDVIVEIVDNYDMTVNINVISEITPEIRVVLDYPGFPPKPAGVQYKFNYGVDYSKTFGFEGMTEIVGFDQGTFLQ